MLSLKYLSSLVLKLDRIAINNCWKRIPYINYSVKKEVFRFLRPEAFTNDFESVVSGASFPVNNKVIANIDVVKAIEPQSDRRAVFVFQSWIS